MGDSMCGQMGVVHVSWMNNIIRVWCSLHLHVSLLHNITRYSVFVYYQEVIKHRSVIVNL